MRRARSSCFVLLALCCDPLAHAQEPEIPAERTLTVPQWGKLPIAMHRHGAAVAQGRLYIIGGASTMGWTGSVFSALLDKESRPGAWRNESRLPEARGYIANSVAVSEGKRIYIAGGNAAGRQDAADSEVRKLNNVIWASIAADGVLDAWKSSKPFKTAPISCVAACVADGWLVVSGGSTDDGVQNMVQVARIGDDGAPGEWTLTNPLPTPLWYHGMSYLDGKLYIVGGLSKKARSSASAKVYSAKFAQGLVAGAWTEETDMPNGLYASAALGTDGRFVCVGGRYANDYPTNTIRWMDIAPNGAAVWQTYRSDISSYSNHAVAFDANSRTLLVTGGNAMKSPGAASHLLESIQAFRL